MDNIALKALHQIQEYWAGRNFITTLRVNSLLITHARMQERMWNLLTDQLSNNKSINGILGCRRDLAWLEICDFKTSVLLREIFL